MLTISIVTDDGGLVVYVNPEYIVSIEPSYHAPTGHNCRIILEHDRVYECVSYNPEELGEEREVYSRWY